MQNSIQINEALLKQKFDQIADKADNKVDVDQFRQLLSQIDLDQPTARTRKIAQGFYICTKAKSPLNLLKSFNITKPPIEKPIQQDNGQQNVQKDEDEDDEQERIQADQQDPEAYRLNFQQVLKGALLLTNKIKYQIWKLTVTLYAMQNELAAVTKRAFFPVKDPGHLAKVNIVVGEQMPIYNSYLRVKIVKKVRKGAGAKKENESKIVNSSKKKEIYKTQSIANQQQEMAKQRIEKSIYKAVSFQKQQDQVRVIITFVTSKSEQSAFFADIWAKIYELVSGMVQGEFSDGKYFLSSIKITTDIKPQHFQIKVVCHNPQLNQLLFAVTNFLDVIFKTQVKFALQFLLEFGFDLKNLIQNKKASIYDFLTQNVRIKLNYQGSEYVTALKELMIAHNAFEGVQWVSTDQTSLLLIALVSSHILQLNLKFKNAEHNNAQQQSLRQIFELLQEEVRPMLQNLKEQSPQAYDLLINGLRKVVKLEAYIQDLHVKAEVYLQNIDKLLLQDSKFMGYQGNSEGQEPQQNEQQNEEKPSTPQSGNQEIPPNQPNQQNNGSESDD